jgi:glycosyltransferase involved in cell wall biosynthesis
MASLRLCMLAPEFFPVWGGTGSYIIELIKSLPPDVEIHVLTLRRKINGVQNRNRSNELNSLFKRPIEVHYLSESSETFFYNLPFQLSCFAKIPDLHRQYKFDIIHSHLCHMPDVYFRLFNRIPLPTILTLHGTIQMLRDHALLAQSKFHDLEAGEESILKFYPFISFLQQNYVKHVSRFIAVSNATKQIAANQLQVKKDKIDVVYNGVDTELFAAADNNEVQKKFSNPTVAYVGRLVSKKGIHILIKAMPEVLRSVPNAKFLFVGGGDIPLYRQLLNSLQIPEKNYSFVGHLGYFERPKIMREATVFVNPSFFENCSLSILEAMSSGCATVAAYTGGNPEIIETGNNGLLVPSFDHESLGKSIVELLENEKYNKQLGTEARKTVENSFSSKIFAENTNLAYERTLNSC